MAVYDLCETSDDEHHLTTSDEDDTLPDKPYFMYRPQSITQMLYHFMYFRLFIISTITYYICKLFK